MAKLSYLLFTALAASACTDAPDDGVTLTVAETDHVAGSFTRGDTSLSFDFTRDEAGHHASVWSDGELLVASDLEGAFETQRFGSHDELVMSGPIGRPTTIDGDQSRLTAPALQLVGQLREALEARPDVDADLVSPPKPKDTVADAYWGSDGYLHLGPGETGQLGTQPFWWRTEVVMKNFSGRCVTVTFQVGLGFETHVIPAYQYQFDYGYWWAAWLYVTNLNAYVDWSYLGLGVCGPGYMGVFTRYGN